MIKALRDTLIIIAITGAMLVVLELALRVIFPGKIDNKVPLEALAYEHNDCYLISLKKNVEKEFRVDEKNGGGIIEWRTNAHGFRGDNIDGNRSTRVIVYGDSNVQARFTRSDRTFTAVLQNDLYNRGIDAKVINAGLVGAGPDQNLIRLAEDIDQVKPDVVVFHVFADNDFGDIVRNRLFEINPEGSLVRTPHPVTKDHEITSREPTFFNWLNDRLIVKAVMRLAAGGEDPDSLSDAEQSARAMNDLVIQSEIEHEIYIQRKPREISHFADHYDIDIALEPESESAQLKLALMEKVLTAANELASSRQAVFVVTVQPAVFDMTANVHTFGYRDLMNHDGYSPDNLTAPMREICTRNTLNCIHLVDHFRQNDPESLYRNGDNHWNDKGQRISAEATSARIAELLR